MKNIKKTSLKILFTIALLCSVTFADGDMGGGGLVDVDAPVTVDAPSNAEGDMGGGGRGIWSASNDYIDSALVSVQGFFDAIF